MRFACIRGLVVCCTIFARSNGAAIAIEVHVNGQLAKISLEDDQDPLSVATNFCTENLLDVEHASTIAAELQLQRDKTSQSVEKETFTDSSTPTVGETIPYTPYRLSFGGEVHTIHVRVGFDDVRDVVEKFAAAHADLSPESIENIIDLIQQPDAQDSEKLSFNVNFNGQVRSIVTDTGMSPEAVADIYAEKWGMEDESEKALLTTHIEARMIIFRQEHGPIQQIMAESLERARNSLETARLPVENESLEERLRRLYLYTLEMTVTGSLMDEAPDFEGVPYTFEKRGIGEDWPKVGHTMIGHARIQQLKDALEEVILNGIPGDVCELGVWRGGAMIYAKGWLNANGVIDRKVILFDAFAPIKSYGRNDKVDFLTVTLPEVQHNFDKYGLADDKVVYVKGFFKDSLPTFLDQFPETQIAILRIDANYYDSYEDAMMHLYPKVPIGGIIIFDEVRFTAVMWWFVTFRQTHGLPEELIHIDHYSAWFRKTVDVPLKQDTRRYNLDVNYHQELEHQHEAVDSR